jgi:hypothetical protein
MVFDTGSFTGKGVLHAFSEEVAMEQKLIIPTSTLLKNLFLLKRWDITVSLIRVKCVEAAAIVNLLRN